MARLQEVTSVREVERLLLDVVGLLLSDGNSMTGDREETSAEELLRFLEGEPRLTEWTLKTVKALVLEGHRAGLKIPAKLVQLLGTAETVETSAPALPA